MRPLEALAGAKRRPGRGATKGQGWAGGGHPPTRQPGGQR